MQPHIKTNHCVWTTVIYKTKTTETANMKKVDITLVARDITV